MHFHPLPKELVCCGTYLLLRFDQPPSPWKRHVWSLLLSCAWSWRAPDVAVWFGSLGIQNGGRITPHQGFYSTFFLEGLAWGLRLIFFCLKHLLASNKDGGRVVHVCRGTFFYSPLWIRKASRFWATWILDGSLEKNFFTKTRQLPPK